MSMDEQYEQMRIFASTLSAFNEHLRASVADLQAQHDDISPLWQDSMRRDYDSQWLPLAQHMRSYLTQQGPAYEQFLRDKLHALEAYLYGH